MTQSDSREPTEELDPADSMTLAIMQGDTDAFVEAYWDSRDGFTAYSNIVLIINKMGSTERRDWFMYPFAYDLLKEVFDRKAVFEERISIWKERLGADMSHSTATELEKIAIDFSGEGSEVRDVMFYFAVEAAFRLGVKYDKQQEQTL